MSCLATFHGVTFTVLPYSTWQRVLRRSRRRRGGRREEGEEA